MTHGVVVLTKTDMVDEEWLELVTEDVREYLEGTFLQDAPILPVSAVSGQGLDDLVKALDEMAADLEERPAHGPFRLPVDRVFVMRGFGSVVTGTAIGGQVEVGQEVEVYPSRLKARVRGLQVHNQEVQSARRGQRTAMNLQGLDKAEIRRGGRGGHPELPGAFPVAGFGCKRAGRHTPAHQAPRAHPLPHRLLRGHGAHDVFGTGDELKPGEQAYCQVRLEEAVAVMAGDRFVARSYSPVAHHRRRADLHPHSTRHKRNRPEITDDLKDLAPRRLPATYRGACAPGRGKGLAAADLVRLVNLPQKELDGLLADMLSKRELVRFDKEAGRMLTASVQENLKQRALEIVAGFHKQQPLKPGIPREELKQRLGKDVDVKLFSHMLNTLTGEDEIVAEKDLLAPAHPQGAPGRR